MVLLLHSGRCYEAEICTILFLLRCPFKWCPFWPKPKFSDFGQKPWTIVNGLVFGSLKKVLRFRNTQKCTLHKFYTGFVDAQVNSTPKLMKLAKISIWHYLLLKIALDHITKYRHTCSLISPKVLYNYTCWTRAHCIVSSPFLLMVFFPVPSSSSESTRAFKLG